MSPHSIEITPPQAIKIPGEKGQDLLALRGFWNLRGLAMAPDVRHQIKRLALDDIAWNLHEIAAMDSAGALILWRAWGERLPGRILLRPEQARLFKRLQSLDMPAEPVAPRPAPLLSRASRSIQNFAVQLLSWITLLGQVIMDFLYLLRHPLEIPWKEISAAIHETDGRALGITALVGFLIGIVVSYLSSLQLRTFGAAIYIVNILGLSIIRELGPLLAAILVAGRSGSALVAASVWLGHYGEERDVYTVITQSSISGLNPESTVLYRGVQVGKVSAIRFDPMNSRNILVNIEVEKGLPITLGTYAKLRVQGLTGLAQIELGDSGENQQALITDKAHPAQIHLQPSLIDTLSDSGGDILLGSQQLINHLNEWLDEENRQSVKAILTHMETATGRLANLEAHMNQAFARVDQAASKVDKAGEAVIKAGAKAQTSLNRLDPIAEGLAHSSLPRFNALLEELQATSLQIRRLSGLLEKDPQMLIYGHQTAEPGPGEPGFQEPKP